jgi:hypothetical protein
MGLKTEIQFLCKLTKVNNKWKGYNIFRGKVHPLPTAPPETMHTHHGTLQSINVCILILTDTKLDRKDKLFIINEVRLCMQSC